MKSALIPITLANTKTIKTNQWNSFIDVLLMIKLKFVLLRSEKQLYSGIPFHIKNLKAVILSKLHSVQQKAQLRPIA